MHESPITLTVRQARQFLLSKHGLLGEHRFAGKQGALAFARQVGCIQYDPIDVCGKNSELVLQSRVQGFTKTMLDELLYTDRALVDYPDKNLSIVPTEDWPYFERDREISRQNAERYPEMRTLTQQVRTHIEANGVVCSDDIRLDGEIEWWSPIHWSSGSKASRAALEHMYATGELVVHHKKGARKYYDIAERHIPAEILHTPEPFPDDFEHRKWRVLRRIGAIGLLWDRPSDAWLHIWDLKSPERNEIFRQLLLEEKIFPVAVEGIKCPLYCRSEDLPLVPEILKKPRLKPRCELIAPLDNLMWDRKLIKALFDFDYMWEIYTPAHKRKFGYYVLPLLCGETFAGRVEAVVDRKTKTLVVKNVWYENDTKQTQKLQTALDNCLKRFAKFNDCETIETA
ncbi:winged helix DNA-binding domain-containing protein [Synergistaceae bacterium OttesenSCG-928-I11]|nr:winged helix DNA-binding domain-containing protein [Synergistaceae bacterium OttesenSCG-928-I11]